MRSNFRDYYNENELNKEEKEFSTEQRSINGDQVLDDNESISLGEEQNDDFFSEKYNSEDNELSSIEEQPSINEYESIDKLNLSKKSSINKDFVFNFENSNEIKQSLNAEQSTTIDDSSQYDVDEMKTLTSTVSDSDDLENSFPEKQELDEFYFKPSKYVTKIENLKAQLADEQRFHVEVSKLLRLFYQDINGSTILHYGKILVNAHKSLLVTSKCDS